MKKTWHFSIEKNPFRVSLKISVAKLRFASRPRDLFLSLMKLAPFHRDKSGKYHGGFHSHAGTPKWMVYKGKSNLNG